MAWMKFSYRMRSHVFSSNEHVNVQMTDIARDAGNKAASALEAGTGR